MVSANCVRRSSGNDGRSRNSGIPNEKALLINVCGDRPPTELVGSPGSGGWLNSNSQSRPHWKRNSLIRRLEIVEASLKLRNLALTKSSPKLSLARVLVAWV